MDFIDPKLKRTIAAVYNNKLLSSPIPAQASQELYPPLLCIFDIHLLIIGRVTGYTRPRTLLQRAKKPILLLQQRSCREREKYPCSSPSDVTKSLLLVCNYFLATLKLKIYLQTVFQLPAPLALAAVPAKTTRLNEIQGELEMTRQELRASKQEEDNLAQQLAALTLGANKNKVVVKKDKF